VATYTGRLNIGLMNYYADDIDLVLAYVDVSTPAGDREAKTSIGSVIDRMSMTQTIVGAKKIQLTSNLERLSAILVQTHVNRGRVLDTDYSAQAFMLAKKQNLAGAASQMIALATKRKNALISILI
jgi:flagellin-like hook-associated protein FlgL